MKNYNTVSEAVNDLVQRGYSIDFTTEINKQAPKSLRAFIELPSPEFHVDETYRFESDTDLENEMIVFAIASLKNNIKGVIANCYGGNGKVVAAPVYEDGSLLEKEAMMENEMAV